MRLNNVTRFVHSAINIATRIIAASLQTSAPCMIPLLFDSNHIEGYTWFEEANGKSGKSIRYLQMKKSLLHVYLPMTRDNKDKYNLANARVGNFKLEKGAASICESRMNTLKIVFPGAPALYITTTTPSELSIWYNYVNKAAIGGPVSCQYDDYGGVSNTVTEASLCGYAFWIDSAWDDSAWDDSAWDDSAWDDSAWNDVLSESSLSEETFEKRNCGDVAVGSTDEYTSLIKNDDKQF